MWWRRLRYVVLLAALCAIATCPSAKRACTANARAQEAEEMLTYLAGRVDLAFAAAGKLPPVAAGPTPATSCCDANGGACAADPTIWATPGWSQLGFSIDDDFRYTYTYVPDPSGKFATLRAVGDLDCDDVKSLYEVKLTVSGPILLRSWSRSQPTE